MDDMNPKSASLYVVSADEAYTLINAKATHFPPFIRIYLPKSPYEKLNPSLELRGSAVKSASSSSLYEAESDLERSLRRTRKTFKDIVLCNQFSLLVTFTFKQDRQDIDKCKTKMSNWFKNQRKRTGRFDYIVAPEFHKDQASLHFHALLKDFNGKVEPAINAKTGNQIRKNGRLVYKLPSYTLGFTNVQKIDSNKDSLTKVAFYLQKYITKDMPVFANKNRYWASQGLSKPIVEDNPPEWYLFARPDRVYENEHGKILEFDVANNALAALYHKYGKQ